MSDRPRFTFLGKALSFLLVIGLIALGAYMLTGGGDLPGTGGTETAEEAAEGESPDVSEVQVEVPRLAPPAPFNYKDNIVPIEISEYAGYAGLIAANGGLEPTENSVFFKNHGFKVRLTISEDESWSELNEGKIAGSVTTVDVLAAYGRQLHAVVPAQIGFSRGADGVIVRSDIKRINQLKGQTIAAAQFTEVDFFIRYLAQEAGLEIQALGGLDATPHPDRLNLVYTEDGFAAGDLFAADLKSGRNRLAGAVTWEPKVSEVVDGSGGKAHVLTTNRNLLIVADVLILHRGFAEQHPKIVEGLVQGLLEGNRMVRDQQAQHLDVIARAFKWSRDDATGELAQRAPVQSAREPRVLLGRHRRGRQLRRDLPVRGAGVRQRPDQGSAGREPLLPRARRSTRWRRAGSSRTRSSPSRRSARAAARRSRPIRS